MICPHCHRTGQHLSLCPFAPDENDPGFDVRREGHALVYWNEEWIVVATEQGVSVLGNPPEEIVEMAIKEAA